MVMLSGYRNGVALGGGFEFQCAWNNADRMVPSQRSGHSNTFMVESDEGTQSRW